MMRFESKTEEMDDGWYGWIKLTDEQPGEQPGEPATMKKGPYSSEEEALEQIQRMRAGLEAEGFELLTVQ